MLLFTMLFRILGTGTSQISTERTSPSNYVEIGDKKILVDCGSGTMMRLSQAGIQLKTGPFLQPFYLIPSSNVQCWMLNVLLFLSALYLKPYTFFIPFRLFLIMQR